MHPENFSFILIQSLVFGFIFVIEDQKKSYSGSNWWKPAVQIFTQVSGWIAAPIILALVFGKMLDAHYGTRPVIFLILAGVGFLITCFGIVRIVGKYIKDIKDLGDKNN